MPPCILCPILPQIAPGGVPSAWNRCPGTNVRIMPSKLVLSAHKIKSHGAGDGVSSHTSVLGSVGVYLGCRCTREDEGVRPASTLPDSGPERIRHRSQSSSVRCAKGLQTRHLIAADNSGHPVYALLRFRIGLSSLPDNLPALCDRLLYRPPDRALLVVIEDEALTSIL